MAKYLISIIPFFLLLSVTRQNIQHFNTFALDPSIMSEKLQDTSRAYYTVTERISLHKKSKWPEYIFLKIEVFDGNKPLNKLSGCNWVLFNKNGHQIEVSGPINTESIIAVNIYNKSRFKFIQINNLDYGDFVRIPLNQFSNEQVTLKIVLFQRNYLL